MARSLTFGLMGLVLTGVAYLVRRRNPHRREEVAGKRLDWVLGATAASFASAVVAELIR